jgi:hypothetical protein
MKMSFIRYLASSDSSPTSVAGTFHQLGKKFLSQKDPGYEDDSSRDIRLTWFALPISHFPIEQRTGSSRLFGGTKNKQYAEYGI